MVAEEVLMLVVARELPVGRGVEVEEGTKLNTLLLLLLLLLPLLPLLLSLLPALLTVPVVAVAAVGVVRGSGRMARGEIGGEDAGDLGFAMGGGPQMEGPGEDEGQEAEANEKEVEGFGGGNWR